MLAAGAMLAASTSFALATAGPVTTGRANFVRTIGTALTGQGRPGETTTPPARGERRQTTLKVGDLAPDFTLSDPKGSRQVTLSSFRGKKPVVLVFGSYT
jgi:hypothetical protein